MRTQINIKGTKIDKKKKLGKTLISLVNFSNVLKLNLLGFRIFLRQL